MLERIREGAQGPWAMGIIVIIVLSFVLAGVGSYLTSPPNTAVAKVNGEEISANELERAYQNQRQQMEAQFGEGISTLFADPGYLAQFREQVLQRLINDMVVKQKAEAMGLRASDDQVKETIRSFPQFQVAGQFNNERYLAAIRQSGYQASEFREYIRRELTRDQLAQALGLSGFALENAAKQLAELEQQTRDAKILTVNASAFSDAVVVSDEEIQVYYSANLPNYDTEEKVGLAYVELKVDDLIAGVEVSPEQVLEYYENNIVAYQTQESRRVSHILVEFGDDKNAAQARILSLAERIRAGEDFAAVASEASDDTFSAENGGDLGEIGDGVMGDIFENAAFALANEGDVSDMIETEFGFHLIKVTEINAQQTQAFDEVSQEIEATLRRDAALDEFYALQTTMADLAFEISDSLDDVATELNTTVKTTGLLTKAFAPTPFDRADIAAIAFSPELIDEQVNSEVIEISDEHIMVMRVVEHEPQRTQELEEVKQQITASLRSEKAQQAARSWAETLVETMAEDSSAAQALLVAQGLEWSDRLAVSRTASDIAPAMTAALFSLNTADGENIEVVDLGDVSVGVVQLTAVNQVSDIDETTISQYQQRLASSNTNAQVQAFVEALREETDVIVTSTALN